MKKYRPVCTTLSRPLYKANRLFKSVDLVCPRPPNSLHGLDPRGHLRVKPVSTTPNYASRRQCRSHSPNLIALANFSEQCLHLSKKFQVFVLLLQRCYDEKVGEKMSSYHRVAMGTTHS